LIRLTIQTYGGYADAVTGENDNVTVGLRQWSVVVRLKGWKVERLS